MLRGYGYFDAALLSTRSFVCYRRSVFTRVLRGRAWTSSLGAIIALTLVRVISTANNDANNTEQRREVEGGLTIIRRTFLFRGRGFKEAFRPLYFDVFGPAVPPTLRDDL
jgi:hypothetical protein